MTSSEYIIEVSEHDFEYNVLAYSHKTPVVVDFWAEWCVPCKTLAPMLERLAEEGKGAFRLAKINVDKNPNLAQRFNIRSIPAVKAFRDEVVVAEFMGLQPEPKIREFIKGLAPSQADLVLEKGQSLLLLRDYVSAEASFRQFLKTNHDHPGGRLGLIKSLLLQGKINDAHQSIAGFPDSKELAVVDTLRPLVHALERVKAGLPESDQPLDAMYANALRLAMRGNLLAAMDGILDVLRQNKHYREGEPRRVMVGMLALLGEEDPLTRQYRSELASVLF